MKLWKQIVAMAVLVFTLSMGALAVNINAGEDSAAVDAAEVPIVTQSAEVKPDHTLRILAIGNSFTNDTMRFVSKIANSAGYDVTVGVLWKGSIALSDHLAYIQNDAPEYQFDQFTRESGYDRVTQENVTPSTVLQQDWDLVFLQQISHLSGEPSSYYDTEGNSYVTQLIQLIRAQCPNPDLSFSWLMGWAYAQDFTGSAFSRYNNDQMTMYRAIANTVENTVWATGELESVIPVGTSLQNIRSSYVGDSLNRDGRHLSYGMGRYAAGMTVAAAIGIDLSDVTYHPIGTTNVSDLHWPMLRETVSNAVLYPFQVTNSSFTKEPAHGTPSLREVEATAKGVEVKWKGVSHAATYSVTRRATGGEWSCVKTLSAEGSGVQTYTDKTAQDGTEYEYRIKAHFDANLSKTYSGSDIVCWLGKPTKVKAVSMDEALKLQGKVEKGATEYRVRCSTSKKMKNAKVLSVPATGLPIKITGLKPNTKYYMQVQRRKHTDEKTYSSDWSAVASGKTSKYLTRVKDVDYEGKKQAISIKWKEYYKAEQYEIRYSTKKDMSKEKRIVVSGSRTSKTIRSLIKEKKYYFQMRVSRTYSGKTYVSRWSTLTECKTL